MAKETGAERRDRLQAISVAYFQAFEDNIDARRMPPERFERLPELMAKALERGAALTDEELGIEGEVPIAAQI